MLDEGGQILNSAVQLLDVRADRPAPEPCRSRVSRFVAAATFQVVGSSYRLVGVLVFDPPAGAVMHASAASESPLLLVGQSWQGTSLLAQTPAL